MKNQNNSLKVYFKLMRDLRIFHKNCDPTDMSKEEAKKWTFYDKLFNPGNYTAEELKKDL